MDKIHNVIIIGAGPAGLTAGIYASRAQLAPLIFDGPQPGGQLIGTSYIENWPGNLRILGPELMKNMRDHAQHFGSTFVGRSIEQVDFSHAPFRVFDNRATTYHAHSIIIATGASPNRLNCPGEDTYWGKGVTTCAVCDGAFYKDKQVVVVGGGDSAMESASFLKTFTKNITIIQITEALTASRAMQERILTDPDIHIIYNATVSGIQGNNSLVTGVTITDQKTGKNSELPTNGVFLAIGLTPNTAPFKNQLTLNDYGYIEVTDHTHTSREGVFVAGDVFDARYRQAITAAGSGCMAALDAERYLKNQKIL